MHTVLTVPLAVIDGTTVPELQQYREVSRSWRSDHVDLSHEQLAGAAGDRILENLAVAAAEVGAAGFARVVESVQASRKGTFTKIPSFAAAAPIISNFLLKDAIDGWVYRTGVDGHLHPYLVVDIEVEKRDKNDSPRMRIRLRADDPSAKKERPSDDLIYLSPADVTRKAPADVLLNAGLYKETAALKADYEKAVEAFTEILTEGFAQQYRFTGQALTGSTWAAPNSRSNRKVIHDTHRGEVPAPRVTSPTGLAPEDIVRPVPILTKLRVFDLVTHEFMTVNTRDITAYVYDKNLRDKLILPDDQRELLDILTTDIETFTGDIIEGKSSGNVILAKGVPGIGKTLTAEIYSEIIERPLYSIHSGSLGVNAPDVRKNLETVFTRAKRWNVVLLLDEADVFVLERGENIDQNAIVAEFLRTMEYFDGLLFMTTNRANDIDDAILSRCAAIIDYQVPGRDDARKVWEVLANNLGVTLPAELLDELVDGFATITPRDIKMLLRLALRVASHRGVELSITVFQQCAIFRGLHFASTAAA